MCPNLIEIGSKTAEKNSAQTNRQQTNRHHENNGHLAVNQYLRLYQSTNTVKDKDRQSSELPTKLGLNAFKRY